MSVARTAPSGVLPTSDAELMRRVQDDDSDAFAQLYDRHCSRAFRVALAVCPRSNATEDAVQEGFISVWKSRRAYQARRGEVAAWVMTIVRNRAIDVARRSGVHEQRRADAELLEGHAGAVHLDADAIAGDDAHRLRADLGRLPAAQREVITLAFYGELTHIEIAAHLQIPSGTVKGRMRLGLEKLGNHNVS